MNKPRTEIMAPPTLEGRRDQFRHYRAAAIARGWTAAEFLTVARSLVTETTPDGWVKAAQGALDQFTVAARTGTAPAAIGGEKLARYDVFFRTWSRNKAKMFSPGNVRTAQVFSRPAGLATVLENAWAAGCSFGNGQSGVYEVQGDEGIWKHYRGRQMTTEDVGTERVVFLSWEEMEKIELAGGIPFSEVEDPTTYEDEE